MTTLRKAEKTIIDFGALLPAAKKVIEAHKILVLLEAYALVREAKKTNKHFLVLSKEQCDKIKVALLPHVYCDTNLFKKGYVDHFLLKQMPVFEEGEELPDLKDMPMYKIKRSNKKP